MKRRGFFRFLGLAAVAAPLAGMVGTAEQPSLRAGDFRPVKFRGERQTGVISIDPSNLRVVVGGVDVGPPLTFEAQQADCDARGCSLGVGTRHGTDTPTYAHGYRPYAGVTFTYESLETDDLARVDAWRRSLHAPVYPFVRRADEDHTATYSNIVETEPRLYFRA